MREKVRRTTASDRRRCKGQEGGRCAAAAAAADSLAQLIRRGVVWGYRGYSTSSMKRMARGKKWRELIIGQRSILGRVE